MANTVTQVQLKGSNSPTFIVKSGDLYYVTQSVAAYDRERAKTPEEIADVDGVRALFEEAWKEGRKRDAVELPKDNNVMSFQHAVSDDL